MTMPKALRVFTDILIRLVATFTASALSIISGAAIIGDIEMHKAALLAGFVSVAQVAQRLASAAIDGDLTAEEIDEAFLGAKITRK
ncbi:MAG: hypothetical protein EB168_09905 [Euryarchaeota archaeon]|nr:hypothetical protein [Euryarchaeota archaeon]